MEAESEAWVSIKDGRESEVKRPRLRLVDVHSDRVNRRCRSYYVGQSPYFRPNMIEAFHPVHPPMLLSETLVAMVHGSGFCEEFGQNHFRTILLPPMATLEAAYDKMESFIKRKTQ